MASLTLTVGHKMVVFTVSTFIPSIFNKHDQRAENCYVFLFLFFKVLNSFPINKARGASSLRRVSQLGLAVRR